MAENKPQTLSIGSGEYLAYHHTPGTTPGVLFLGGFMSDMTSGKALALETWCREHGRQFTRFDYRGHGQSSGKFADGCIGDWLADALAVLDTITSGPQVLVGSSMGGWMMLMAALARPERLAGLVGIASAPDFTEELMWEAFTEETKRHIMETGVFHQPSAYGDTPYTITRRLIEDGRQRLLFPQPAWPITVPVRLLHGMADPDVPWTFSTRIAEKLQSSDVRVHLVKAGDHRLSTLENIRLILSCVGGICGSLRV